MRYRSYDIVIMAIVNMMRALRERSFGAFVLEMIICRGNRNDLAVIRDAQT